ncbi:hypothetical protein [Dongia sp.]|uniref:hypothetical protein n=1 Tax=Dongia sp. TaxID=1977262 RepID=UPI0037513075
MRILIPDTWHFHRRNFAPLYDHLAAAQVPFDVERTRRAWWKSHGDYGRFARRLRHHVERLNPLSPSELVASQHNDISLMAVVRSEFLCRALPRWIAGAGPRDDLALAERALGNETDRSELLLCFAAAIDWIDFWRSKLDRTPAFTHVLVFSGSYIYTRALQEVAQRRGLRIFTLESFFTGNDFYFEERATAISNRSQLSVPDYYRRLVLPDERDQLDRWRAEAQTRFRAKRNKNVRASPSAVVAPPFRAADRGAILVLGQVLNDFSVIETPLPEMSTIAVYRRLIGALLEKTDRNVIFKAHPWERRRPNLRSPVTLKQMTVWREALPDRQRERFRVLEAEPLSGLFPYVDHAIGLSSQGLIEAAQAGLKPIQLGDAFFGGHGFTHDRTLDDALIDDIAAGRLASRLSLAEYRALEDFLVRSLVLHLVSDRPEGPEKIAIRLREPGHTPNLEEARFTEGEARRAWTALVAEMIANPFGFHRIVRPSRWFRRS